MKAKIDLPDFFKTLKPALQKFKESADTYSLEEWYRMRWSSEFLSYESSCLDYQLLSVDMCTNINKEERGMGWGEREGEERERRRAIR